MDIRQAMYVPSPYILTPSVAEPAPLKMVMAALYDTDEPDNPYWKTRIGSGFLTYRRCVLTHFWRSNFDSKFLGVRIPRQPKEARLIVKAEGVLWQSVLKLLERMQTLSFLGECSAILFGQIISEMALVMANFRFVSEGELGSTAYIKELQSQNLALQGLENPFGLTGSPTTYQVVQKAIALGNSNDHFRKEYYMAVVKARMSFVSCLKSQKPRSYTQKKMLRQGRKRGEKRVSF